MLKAHANAKINWALAIEGRRDDGYHEMDMLMGICRQVDNLRKANGNG